MKMYDDYSTIINYNRMDKGCDIMVEQILTAIDNWTTGLTN